MKNFKLIILWQILIVFGVSSCSENSNNYCGLWEGGIQYPGFFSRIIFGINFHENGKFIVNVYKPDENDIKLAASNILFNENEILFKINSIDAVFSGKFNSTKGTLEGIIQIGDIKKELTLNKINEIKYNRRPQTPTPPFPYKCKDIEFCNGNIVLSGTLTIPKENSTTAVILISGGGKHDRDYTIFRHRTFKVLSDYLTKRGIIVLRFDDRGVGKSTGDFSKATSYDFASDVVAGVNFLQSYFNEKNNYEITSIGLIGHSEGGLIASIVASENTSDISFIITLGSPAISGYEYNLQYEESINRALGMKEDVLRERLIFQAKVLNIIIENSELNIIRKEIDTIYTSYHPGISTEEKKVGLKRLLSPWFIYNIRHNPSKYLENIQCPILAIYGEYDIQVPLENNYFTAKKIIRKLNIKNKVIIIPKLNHFFQTCDKEIPLNYGDIQETLSPSLLITITDWILQ